MALTIAEILRAVNPNIGLIVNADGSYRIGVEDFNSDEILAAVVALTTDVVLAAGNNRIGTVSGVLKTVNVTKAVAAVGNYSAEHVLSEDAAAGTAWLFAAIARGNGANGYITGAKVICETTAQVQRLTLYLFTVVPTSNLNDRAANTALLHADLANYVGKIDFPALEDLGGDSEAIVSPSTVGNLPIPFTCAGGADDLYGILVTRDAFTNEAAGEDYTVSLTVEQY